MSTGQVWEVALAVILSLGGGGVIVAALSAWLGKVWVDRLLQREITKQQSELEAIRSQFRRSETEHSEALKAELSRLQTEHAETIKSQLKRLESEHSVRFARLHERQAEVIAGIYEKAYAFSGAVEGLKSELHGREIREEIDRTSPWPKREKWEMEPGIDTLSPREEERVRAVSHAAGALFSAFGANRLYLPVECCVELDRFCTVALFLSDAYQNIALKDRNGHLYVNPKVRESWDKSLAALPQVMWSLETQFRAMLGVTK